MNERSNLPSTQDELTNLQTAADSESGGLQKMLKFRKGHYYIGEDEIELGVQYIAHPVGWTKCWIKFIDRKFVERKMYRVGDGRRVPDRDEMGDTDPARWGPGMQGPHSDPWTLQYMLPLEDPVSSEVVIFVTPSFGGKRAISELCGTYARRYARDKTIGLPMIRLDAGEMKTGKYGMVDCPVLKLIGWTGEQATGEPVREVKPPKDDMDDEIPF